MYIIMFLLFIETIIKSVFNFSYIDELITIFLIVFASMKRISDNKIVFLKQEKQSIKCMILIAMLGIIATFIYNLQDNYILGIEGALFYLKAFICYFCYKFLYHDRNINEKKEKNFLNIIEFCIYCVALLGILDRFVHIFPTRDVRFGILTTPLFFSRPTLLAFFASAGLIMTTFFRINKYPNRKYLILDIISSSFLIIITGRMKALGFLLFFLLLFFIISKVKKINIFYLIIPLLIVLVFTSQSIDNYFFNETSARGVLLNTSLKVATDYPIGAGFSTFGTELSRSHYSILYYNYGINRVYGISPEYSSFICDSMWPAVLGETGFIGFILIILIIINFYRYVPNKTNKYNLFFIIITVSYIIFESVGDTIFMTSRGCLLFTFLAYIILTFERGDKNGINYNNTDI